MRYFSLLLLCFFIACSSESDLDKSIKAYLGSTTDLSADEIILIGVSDPIPFYAADSLNSIESALNAKKEDIRTSLNKAIEASKKAIEHSNEAKKGGFKALEPMINEQIAKSEKQIELAELKIKELDGDMRGTGLEKVAAKVEHYRSLGDEILFYSVSGEYSVKNGSSNSFALMTAKDQVTILGESQ